ncbi:hypothetical protein [Phormidium sp. CCY1219]|uniref:hypothetical protein n=1 Tax=Phormidium sp. CCY1219 TaxID=2886104 RepID=UPI002D1E8796|nr:hypothetical protein [Phormidium sp. CCY1219]MEB3826465.1 hypothetical protein [Phormidium sp. CCY1219]
MLLIQDWIVLQKWRSHRPPFLQFISLVSLANDEEYAYRFRQQNGFGQEKSSADPKSSVRIP